MDSIDTTTGWGEGGNRDVIRPEVLQAQRAQINADQEAAYQRIDAKHAALTLAAKAAITAKEKAGDEVMIAQWHELRRAA